MDDFSLSDLQTVIPAVRSAWVRVTLTTPDKEWLEVSLAVLAYAVLPDGYGAYMVDASYVAHGPVWIRASNRMSDGAHGVCSVETELVFGERPSIGKQPSVPYMAYSSCYTFEPLLDLWEYLRPITA